MNIKILGINRYYDLVKYNKEMVVLIDATVLEPRHNMEFKVEDRSVLETLMKAFAVDEIVAVEVSATDTGKLIVGARR